MGSDPGLLAGGGAQKQISDGAVAGTDSVWILPGLQK